jgi:hypothetical protein
MVRREPMPSSRAILWKPLPDSYHLLASMMRAIEQQAQLFITQRAFLQVERHLASAPDLELGGFLAGYLGECPRTQARYAIVNTVIPFAEVTGEPIGVRVTDQAYKAVSTRLRGHGLALIGWYRNGAGLGLQLLPDDVETHLTYFGNPWQTTLLVLPDASKPKGAFFTYDPRVGRSYCIPFYELFDAAKPGADRLALTCVGWKTYVPSVPVQPMPSQDREVIESTVRPYRGEPEVQPPDPIDEWWDAIKDPWVRLKDVAVSATRHDDDDTPPVVLPPATMRDSLLPAPATPSRPPVSVPVSAAPTRAPEAGVRAPAPAPAAAPLPNGGAKGTSRPIPPFVGPIRSVAQLAVQPEALPRSSAAQKSEPTKAPVRPPASPPPEVRRRPPAPKPRAIPAATAAAMAATNPPASFALPPDFQEEAARWQRRRRLGFAVAAASFLAAIALSSLRSRPEQLAQAATNGASVDTTVSSDAAMLAGSEATGVPIPLADAVDSLSRAIAHYRAVEEDHRRGVVGCRVLGRAHAVVARARFQLNASRTRIPGALEVADSLRISMVGAEYTHAAQMYRRSGCQA